MKPLTLSFFSFSTIIIFTLFFNCTNPSQEKFTYKSLELHNDGRTETGVIHIQFVDKPAFNNMLNTKTNSNRGILDYIAFYDDFERSGFQFKEIAINKAVTYSTQSQWVMMRRYFSFFEFQDFLIHKGDSLVISFDQSQPIVTKYSAFNNVLQDLNIENVIDKKYPGSYLTTGMADNTRMVAFKYFYDDPKESERQLARKGYEKGLYLENLENKMASNLLTSAKKLKIISQQVLDSLYDSKKISDNAYNFYQQKYSGILLKLEMMSGSIDSSQAATELSTKFKKLNFQNEYFNQCLDSFEKKYITSKVKWTISGQLNLRDPKESFTLTKNYSLLSPVVKNQMLFISLYKIDLYFPDQTNNYLKLFMNSVKDSALIGKAQSKYQKDEFIKVTPSNLHLLTFDRKQTTIEELLASKKGKLIYLDFWASWCGPCIEEMKYSKSILGDYDRKNLEIIFFSLDDNYMKWNKASERLEINLIMNSFKILNPSDSKFFQEYKLKSIPRYMVVDKNGKMINADAPRPSDPKIRKLFDELLEK